MLWRDPARVLRDEQAELALELGRKIQPDSGDRTLYRVAKTTVIDAYPTVANAFYAVQICDLGDDEEAEGKAAKIEPTGLPFTAWNMSGTIPPIGSFVIISHGVDRWVFDY